MVINLATIDFCPGQGSDPVIRTLDVTENGTYRAPEGVDGYSPVNVNVSGGGLTPEQEDAIDVIINAGDGYLKHTPEVPVIYAQQAIMTLNDVSGFKQQNLYTLNGDVYLHNTANLRLYKFNRQTYQFEEGPQTTSSVQYEHLWADSQGRVYANNEYIVDLETGVYTYKFLGGDFQTHTGSNITNIIEKDGVVYMISYNDSCAYIFNEETQKFDSSIPVQGVFPSSTFYRYFTEFEGHWIYDAGSTQTELEFHLDGAEPYAEWVTLSERLFPGAWSYEYEGQTINETTRGVFVHYVTINNVKEYYTWGYANPVMYKLVNGAWEIVPFEMNVSGFRSQASGASVDDLWLGYGYVSGGNGIIMWNFGDAKFAPDSYTWEQIDLSSYATQEWVNGQGYAYAWLLDAYPYDPQHHLTLTGSVPLVDGKVIATTDQCILNRTVVPGGPSFVQEGSAVDLYFDYYFITPSGRMIAMPSDGSDLYFEWDSINKIWNQNQWNLMNMTSKNILTTTDGKMFYNDFYGIYLWDDLNSEWTYLTNVPQDVQSEFDVWVCGTTLRFRDSFKLTETGGVWSWDTVTTLLDYHSGKSIVCNSNVYILDGTYIYQYDEATTTYTQLGSVNTDGWAYSNFFVFNNELYFSVPRCVFQIDFSRVDPLNPTVDLEIDTDFYHNDQNDGFDYFYGEYDHQLYTVNQNYEFGYCQRVTETLPAVPAADGTYTLKATVLNGQVTYSWVLDI